MPRSDRPPPSRSARADPAAPHRPVAEQGDAPPLIDAIPPPNPTAVPATRPIGPGGRGLTWPAWRQARALEAARNALAGLVATIPLGAGWRHRLDVATVALGASLDRELDRRAGLPWIAVFFALGAALYLTLPAEPIAEVVLVAAVALATGAIVRRRRGGTHAFGMALMAALCAGLAAGAYETRRADEPRLDRQRTVQVTGDIDALQPTARGGRRLTLTVVAMPGVPDAHVPRRVTVTLLAREPALSVGDRVALSARLSPPRGPVMPDGYDFARGRFFEGIGASGFALGKPTVLPFEPRFARALTAAIGEARHAIAARITSALPGDTGAIAVALIVGIESGVSSAAAEALRASGLYHILSISGLHMTLVAGLVLFGLRFGLALIPAIALTVSTKTLAAAAALAITFAYLLLSGADVPAVRAWIMIAVALVAVLIHRRALTQRAVALAALAILAVTPSAVAAPGFQMSFLAVMALVAAWEAKTGPAAERARATRPPLSPTGKAIALVRDAALASLVAGLATAPVAADVFHRMAPYSVIANVVTTPVTGLVVMPAALTAMAAMPFGLEAPVLQVMGWGLSAMITVAETVAAWPGGDGLIGRIHPLSLPLALGGLVWLCLWHERWRYLGVAPVLAALALAPFAARPDVLITDTGQLVAVRGADGELRLSGVKADRFAAGVWLAADADRRAVRQLEGEQSGVRCDPLGCTLTTATTAPPVNGESARIAVGPGPSPVAAGPPPQPIAAPAVSAARPRLIAHVTDASAFEEDCQRADLVITPLVAPARCRLYTTVIDARVLAHTGALTLTWPDPTAPARATPGTQSAAATPIATFAHPTPPRPWTPKPLLNPRDIPPDDPTVPTLIPHDPTTWGPVRVIDTAAQDSGRVDPTAPPEPADDRPIDMIDELEDGADR